jgi:hypothetical protein
MSDRGAPMAWADALAELGLAPGCDEAAARSEYRRRLRLTHPDLSDAGDATERTVRLTAAYRVVLAGLAEPTGAGAHAVDEQPVVATEPMEAVEPDPAPQVTLVDAETIGISAPALEVVPLLIEAAHQLGDITYLDPGAGLLEVVVEFVGAPTSSVVLSLQGRATGVTEVFCSVEPLSGGEAPAADAVTQLLLRTLRGEDPTS